MVFKLSSLLLLCLMSSNLFADSNIVQLQAETWDVSRHGERLIKIPELATIINHWSDNPDLKIELRYPGGEEGDLWVEEFIGWLVSLGVPSSEIQKVPGSDAEDIINISLIKAVINNE